jgi:hypothetical protein
MRKRIGVAMAALLGLVAIGPGVARAGLPTEIVRDASGLSPDDSSVGYFAGHLTSPNPKCLADRKVKILFMYAGSPDPVRVDIDRSSQQGAFAGDGPATSGGNSIVGFVIKVTGKTIGPRHHHKICASFQDSFG